MIDQKIEELELKLKYLEAKANALHKEAKIKYNAGDKAETKHFLNKKEKL